MPTLPFEPTRIVFFTGKGGVGKTSLACAMAVALADSVRRVLLVSTDPASNLDEVLGTALTGTPQEISAAPGLFGLNINPEAAARALKLPAAWEGFLAANTSGTSCLGPLSGLQAQRSNYQASLSALSDAATTTVALVARPDAAALAEAERTRAELAAIGIANQRLFVNGLFTAENRRDPIALALVARQTAVVAWQAERPVGAGALLLLAQAGAAEPVAVGA